jgi:hypothetical protein
MCVYCMIGDHHFRHNPPWERPVQPSPLYPWHPLLPLPVDPTLPIIPWDIARLKEFEDLLRRVHELEEKLGCPCEPNKADYLTLLRQRIEALEKKAANP